MLFSTGEFRLEDLKRLIGPVDSRYFEKNVRRFLSNSTESRSAVRQCHQYLEKGLKAHQDSIIIDLRPAYANPD